MIKIFNLTCAFCGNNFTRTTRDINRKSKNYFCNQKCFGAYFRKPDGCISSSGYRNFRFGNKQFQDHRLIMEIHLNRKLLPTEIVHHINENKTDNRIENLKVLTRSEHMKIHNPLTWNLEEAKMLRNAGWSFNKLGKKFNIHRNAILQVFRKLGLDTKRNNLKHNK